MITKNIVSASIGKEHYKTNLVFKELSFIADEEKENGGQGLGPNPSALLASALASCTAITLRMYAERKGYAIEKIDVDVMLTKEDLNGVMHSVFDRKIRITGNISIEEHERLLVIADKCPVDKILTGEISISTTIE